MSFLSRLYDKLPDADEFFAYDTTREVRVLDRRLGLVYMISWICIALYVVLYVFSIKQLYLSTDQAFGFGDLVISNSSTTSVNLYSEKNWLESLSISRNNMQSSIQSIRSHFQESETYTGTPIDTRTGSSLPGNSKFIPTTVERISQQMGACADDSLRCSTHEDCSGIVDKISPKIRTHFQSHVYTGSPDSIGKCVGGKCVRLKWCDASTRTRSSISDDDHLFLTFQASVTFKGQFFASNFNSPKIPFGRDSIDTWNCISLSNFKKFATSVNSKSSSDSGGIFIANVKFSDCPRSNLSYTTDPSFDSSSFCNPKIEPWSIDTQPYISFENEYFYTRTSGNFYVRNKRTQSKKSGYLIMINAIGEIRSVSISSIILQVSSAIALFGVAVMVADFVMLRVVPEKMHYAEKVHLD